MPDCPRIQPKWNASDANSPHRLPMQEAEEHAANAD
jgi:hypothetical protein